MMKTDGTQSQQQQPSPKKKRNRLKKKKKGKNTSVSLMVVSLNMRGHGTLGPHNTNNKWMQINQLTRTNKIGILAIQEAHLTEDFAEQINELFNRRLLVLWSQGDNSRAKGIAFVINKEIISTESNMKIDNVIPGRAAILAIQWHNNLKIKIMNVYTPMGMWTMNPSGQRSRPHWGKEIS